VWATFDNKSTLVVAAEQGTWLVVWRGAKKIQRVEAATTNGTAHCELTPANLQNCAATGFQSSRGGPIPSIEGRR